MVNPAPIVAIVNIKEERSALLSVNANCHGCGNVGHYEARCFFRKKALMTSIDAAFLDLVNGADKSARTAVVTLGSTNVPFKLDTGAGVI